MPLELVTLRMGVIPIRREGEDQGSGSDVATAYCGMLRRTYPGGMARITKVNLRNNADLVVYEARSPPTLYPSGWIARSSQAIISPQRLVAFSGLVGNR